jgi:hypothetical protein
MRRLAAARQRFLERVHTTETAAFPAQGKNDKQKKTQNPPKRRDQTLLCTGSNAEAPELSLKKRVHNLCGVALRKCF